MNRHGYTLIELLMSLTLMASIAVAITSWTTKALTLQSDRLDDAASDRSASRLERTLRADLLMADARVAAASDTEYRVWVSQPVLNVLSREVGPVEVRYVFDKRAGTIKRSVRPLEGGSAPTQDVIAEDVSDLVWVLDAVDTMRFASLGASWTDRSGQQRSISIAIDREWVP